VPELKIILPRRVMAKRAGCAGGVHQKAARYNADLDSQRAAALVVSQLAVYMVFYSWPVIYLCTT